MAKKKIKTKLKTTSTEENGFLAAIEKNPDDRNARVAYADWLDEHSRPYEALLQRDLAGVSEAWFKLRRKSDGLYSEGRANYRKPIRWSVKGRMWRKLSDLRSHLVNTHGPKTGHYAENTPREDLEIVVIELRMDAVTVLPILMKPDTRYTWRSILVIVEPLGGTQQS
jgi:uncharacterized protein (TIGR02996 family)